VDQPEDKIERPKSLQLLCILTFIGSGLSALSYLVFSVALDTVRQVVQVNDISFLNSAQDEKMITAILHLPRYYFVVHLILYAVSLFGAYLMWSLRKVGFHMYAIAQIILLIIYNIFLPDAQFPVFPLIVTVFFILLYASHLRYMR
jgi:hypothetical protein